MQTQSKLLQVEGVSSETLLQAVSDLLDLKISALKVQAKAKETDLYLTRQEVADLFKISLPTVHAWMNAGILTPYKIANKTRFLRAEVMAAAKGVPSKGGRHE